MGGYIAYPKLGPEQIHKIYNQSRHTPIQGYGYFVDPLKTYMDFCPDTWARDAANRGMSKFLYALQEQLFVAGLDPSYVPFYSTPRRLWLPGISSDKGYLVVLGTGFNQQLHDPEVLKLEERVRAILRTQEEPCWWPMRNFYFPPPPRET